MAFRFSSRTGRVATFCILGLFGAFAGAHRVSAATDTDWSVMRVTVDGKPLPSCPSAAFYQIPNEPDSFIGRTTAIQDRSQCTGPTPYTLALFRMDWSKNDLRFVHTLLPIPTTTPRGIKITAALDPTIVEFRGDTWVAFECGVQTEDNSTCVAPYDGSTGKLDLARLSVPVSGMKDRDSNRHYSASDPKLFVDNDKIYVYWTVVDHVPGEGFIDLTARGTELELQSGVLRPKGEKEQTIYSIDPRGTTEVLELHLNDPTANAVADIYDVRKINGDIIATVAIGGGGSDGKEERCVDQASHNKGCYHLVLLSASAPLGKDVFNRRISGDHSLPYNPVGYAHFIRGPDGKSAIMGTFLPPVAHDPNYNYAPAGLAILNLAGF